MLELCVIFGGQSPEHEISRKSVTSALNNLNKDKYNIFFYLNTSFRNISFPFIVKITFYLLKFFFKIVKKILIF